VRTQHSLRLDPELLERIDAHAKASGQTRNAWIVQALERAVELAPEHRTRTNARAAGAARVPPSAPAGRLGYCPIPQCINRGAIGTRCPRHPNKTFR
jgi:predicted transcriptional regulator